MCGPRARLANCCPKHARNIMPQARVRGWRLTLPANNRERPKRPDASYNRSRPEGLPLVFAQEGRQRAEVTMRRSKPTPQDSHARIEQRLGVHRPWLGPGPGGQGKADVHSASDEPVEPKKGRLQRGYLEQNHVSAHLDGLDGTAPAPGARHIGNAPPFPCAIPPRR